MNEENDKSILELAATDESPDAPDEIFHHLDRLIETFDCVVLEGAAEAEENESLHRLGASWDTIECDRSERWINNDGLIGWRVYVISHGVEAGPRKGVLAALLRDKLLNRGWAGIEVVLL